MAWKKGRGWPGKMDRGPGGLYLETNKANIVIYYCILEGKILMQVKKKKTFPAQQ